MFQKALILPFLFIFLLMVNVSKANAQVEVPSGCKRMPPFQVGDANGDGNVNISDAVIILTRLFKDSSIPLCQEDVPGYSVLADVDASGRLNITDPIYLLNFLFLGGPPPVIFPRKSGHFEELVLA